MLDLSLLQPPDARCYLGGIYVPEGVQSLLGAVGEWVAHCFLLSAYLYPEEVEGETKM